MMDPRFSCLALLMLLAGSFLVGADDDTDCVQKLLPCQPYLMSATPPATCCSPMKEAIHANAKCLCNLFNNPSFLQGFNLTQEQALALPKHCAIEVDMNKCKGAAPGPAATTSPSSSPSGSSSGSIDSSTSSNSTSSPGHETSENKTSSAAHVAYVGSSAVCVASILPLIISAF